jgi:hypothetical protein
LIFDIVKIIQVATADMTEFMLCGTLLLNDAVVAVDDDAVVSVLVVESETLDGVWQGSVNDGSYMV